ncbi:MAG: SDR family NAD(P)-dependent oxidoreductase [Bacteroidota bacterium]
MKEKIILITGATAGFGKATAYKFAEHGWNIIITGRRTERLKEIEEALTKNFSVKVLSLCFDIMKRDEVELAVSSLPHDWKNIDVLVNNAGLAQGLSLIHEGDIDDWETMIDTNLKGLLYISRQVMPIMVAQGYGHIINLGSIAGKQAYLKGNIYGATKFAVDAISKSMRIDLLPHGIKVTNVSPGACETEFSLVRYKGDAERAKRVYEGYTPVSAADVADVIFFAATRPPHVVLNEIEITPLAQANAYYFVKKSEEPKKN